ncbi:hypothetical protein XA68_10975 [Ophiocordyceps unilateralis]|uniref:beta-N-acetylhexosaminidase n=1 Tax=Ophiocordyceps unilateralis TaxID=268505 RepID=A0A2A9PQ95_OPHUN|nr:hypothetical protein XA68_10975 [Ophiocordyceps unilateralis]
MKVEAALLWAGFAVGVALANLPGIPSAPYTPLGSGIFPISRIEIIGVDARHASVRNQHGATLIPPTLRDFAITFGRDLEAVYGVQAEVIEHRGAVSRRKGVFLTLDDGPGYTDAAGRHTFEGYSLVTNRSGIFIAGASPLGVWWGTRTVLQQAALYGRIPHGEGQDSPAWGERGMMLDAGRHYYPKSFLIEMCSYMSFFKQNVFHLHLSDNLHNSTAMSHRGVTVVPEIEAPGHALSIVQWRPQLGLEDLSLLDISHPQTMPTMKLIWREFLPWFHSKVVSIGADEYGGPVSDYNWFVNSMNTFIRQSSNKSIRIWGTFPPKPSYHINIDQDVSIQHWSYHEDNPYHDYIRKDYSVVNSMGDFYVVNKWGRYPNTIDISKTFHGDPSIRGKGPWHPHIFNMKNASDNPRRNEPLVLGAIAPLWNDYGPNASVYSEAYYAWRLGLPALADKQWGGKLTKQQFDFYFRKLHSRIPAQNLDRNIPSKGVVIFEYDLSRGNNVSHGLVKDLTTNGYDASTKCAFRDSSLLITPRCALVTPWRSKGRDYTLSLKLKISQLADPTNTTLVVGADSVLMLTPNVTLFASGNYYRLNMTVPVGELVELTLWGCKKQTFASVKRPGDLGSPKEEEFLVKMGIDGQRFHWDVMAIEAPIEEVTGWNGELFWMRLTRLA